MSAAGRDAASVRPLGALIVGAMASVPTTLAIVGWAIHWNAYTNLALSLGSIGLWLTVWKAWSE